MYLVKIEEINQEVNMQGLQKTYFLNKHKIIFERTKYRLVNTHA